jgi:hypothetical protein
LIKWVGSNDNGNQMAETKQGLLRKIIKFY